MSGHWLVAPILIPLVAALLVLVEVRRPLWQRRALGAISLGALLFVSVVLLAGSADGVVRSYAIGNWPAPYGIVLVLDRLSATMVFITAVLGAASFAHAIRGHDRIGANFHPLFQFQLVGLNGAFLTGDIFNLFVFFEVLLIASYGLMLHGHGRERTRSALHYVVLNITGSSIFLLALGLLYASTGTLNMAHAGRVVAQGDINEPVLLMVSGLLLVVVFSLKSALLPLSFWLPRAYAATSAPAAALFAVMTKVGIYSLLRLGPLLFAGGELGTLVPDWLWWIGLLTILVALLGVLAADSLATLVAWSVVVSMGTLAVGLSRGTVPAWSATLYYLVHTTWVSGGLFLLAGVIAGQRGEQGNTLRAGPAPGAPRLLGALLLVGAMAVAGVPPFSGFVGKVALLRALPAADNGLFWAALLVSGFASLVAFSRAGSTLFWRPLQEAGRAPMPDRVQTAAAASLVVAGVLMAIAAEPLLGWTTEVAGQLLAPEIYMSAVLGDPEA